MPRIHGFFTLIFPEPSDFRPRKAVYFPTEKNRPVLRACIAWVRGEGKNGFIGNSTVLHLFYLLYTKKVTNR
jgi:hypothetical protein